MYIYIIILFILLLYTTSENLNTTLNTDLHIRTYCKKKYVNVYFD